MDFWKAKISFFPKPGTKRNVTDYERAVNEASLKLVKSDPDLLLTQDVLLQKAKDSVRTGGYDFKKGRSRWEFFEPSDPKRKRTSSKALSRSLRQNTLLELKSTAERLKEQIKIKERRMKQLISKENFKGADTVATDIQQLYEKPAVKRIQIGDLEKRNKKSVF